MAQAVMFEKNLAAIVMTAGEVIRALRDTWNRGSRESTSDVIERLGHVPLLVLDEIGVGFGTEKEQVQLFDVINLRYGLLRPTVLISNLEPHEIEDFLGERVYGRLLDGATMLACVWDSYRAGGRNAR